MFRNMIRRSIRKPLVPLAFLLSVSVLSAVLCHLHRSGQDELRSYHDAHASVPVFFKIVDLDGSKPQSATGIDGYVLDLFEDEWPTPPLLPYIGQIHLRISLQGKYYLTDKNGEPVMNHQLRQASRPQTTTGISSTRVAEELTEGWGGKIFWKEGYDESILFSSEYVCIVPESMKESQTMDMEYTYEYWPTGIVGDLGGSVIMQARHSFRVVGYYQDPGNHRIYCPYRTLEQIHLDLNQPKRIEEIGAILSDNSRLAQFKEDAAQWFAAPNPLGEPTPWGAYGFAYYHYALRIDDAMLTQLETNIKNSLRLNQLASIAVFALSAGAGFLVGFLMIRSRKQEVTLMRIMGAAPRSVFGIFAAEQCIIVLAGLMIGGSYTLWQPVGKLALFGCIYLAGLSTALGIFLRKNLLTTIKEDE